MAEANLLAMLTMHDRFGVEVGYSDHTVGHSTCLAAVALGATVIEKHVTLNRMLPGPDHQASIEPDDLKRLVSSRFALSKQQWERPQSTGAVRNREHGRCPEEHRRGPAIAKGERITAEHVTVKRPGTGRSPLISGT